MDRDEDYSKWFLDLVLKAELVEYGIIRGSIVFRPYGYSIWENIKNILDKKIKETGHQNAYFPTLLPKSFLQKEAEHVQGFAPEVFEIHYAWGQKLQDPLVLRPTSETIIWHSFKNWIKSHRDLPLLINQWANVFRMELKTKPFLRTSEFLWQEGHTAHKTEEEALEETKKMLDVYKDLFENYLAVPVLKGKKSEGEKFAGALTTYCIETLLYDKKALQCGTSHYLGQNFSRAFSVSYADENNKLNYPYSSSWGVSSRMIGALIMSHSDNKGLVLPPKVAPFQIVIVPIIKKDDSQEVIKKANEVYNILKEKFFVKLDNDTSKSPGWKFSEYELKGIPVRIDIGSKDIENKSLSLLRRDTLKKQIVSDNNILSECENILDDIHKNLFENAKKRIFENIFDFTNSSYTEFKEFFDSKKGVGLVKAGFFEDELSKDIEKKIKQDTKASIRLIISEKEEDLEGIKCIFSNKNANMLVYFAKSY